MKQKNIFQEYNEQKSEHKMYKEMFKKFIEEKIDGPITNITKSSKRGNDKNK